MAERNDKQDGDAASADGESAQLENPVHESDSAGDNGEQLDALVDEMRAELDELKQRMLRQQADFDNTRKRLRREAEEAGQRALVRFVRPVLGELDNFRLALDAASPEKFQDFAMGVSMIRDNLDGILRESGIEPIPAEGVFDPQWHEVVAEVEDPDQPRGTIAEVQRHGYRLGDQVVRAAQVIVTRPPRDDEGTGDTDAS